MRSMKAALHNVGIQLSPQEMCEALRQADLDGDGTVNFKDFLGVLTDSHRLAQCLGQVRNSRVCDPQGLQTLFLEILFKLMSQGFVPSKSAQEVMRDAQPLLSDTEPGPADAARTQDAELCPAPPRPTSRVLPAQPPQAGAQPAAAQPRLRGPATRVCGTHEAGSLPPNSSAEAALLPFASLFAETSYEELIQVKRLLDETGCARWGRARSGRRSFANVFINLV
ncbi:spermatogenesis-associated protein 21-like [Equus asinus]|uniref:spermatogenesis-associated protein 21-like n=1 Tax=Equus asinus TaxID=9793 RepID=UPI0038F64DEE